MISKTEFYSHPNESKLAELGTYCGFVGSNRRHSGYGRFELWHDGSGYHWHAYNGKRDELSGYVSAKEALIALFEVEGGDKLWFAAGALLGYKLATVHLESQSEPLTSVRHGQRFGSFRAVNVTRRTVKVALVSERDLGWKVSRALTYRWSDAARAFMRQGAALRADGIY